MKQNIVFFGSGEYTIPVVEKLLHHGLDLVITTEKDSDSLLLKFCREKNIQTVSACSSKDLTTNYSLITNHSLAVLASYGAFIPADVINTFPNGIINIHPSLLPKYKGPSPIQYVLLNSDTQTGVTLIKLDNEIDHGPILAQRTYNLKGDETTSDLLSILFEIGAEMVEELIVELENGQTLKETPQNHSQETWSYKITKKDGYIDFEPHKFQISNLKYKINDMIRAYYPWPGVWFRYSPPVITRSEMMKQSSLENKIIKLLPEEKIQVEGKLPMKYKDFINGFGIEGQQILETFNLLD